jgi:hypothetical protein
MTGEPDCRLPARAADAYYKLRAPFAERSEVGRKTRTFEQGRQPLGAGALVAGRVDRSEADKVLSEFN